MKLNFMINHIKCNVNRRERVQLVYIQIYIIKPTCWSCASLRYKIQVKTSRPDFFKA